MAKLEILEYPDDRLRTKAAPVVAVDDEVRTLVDDMLETMYDAHGIGLAATQVDQHRRIIVMDVSDDQSQPRVLINPEYAPLDDERFDIFKVVLTQLVSKSSSEKIAGVRKFHRPPSFHLLRCPDRDSQHLREPSTDAC